MNIETVGTSNTQFRAGIQKPVVNLVKAATTNPIDGKILLALRDCEPKIIELAQKNGLPEVKLAQQRNGFLINTSGPVTSYVEKSKLDSAKALYEAVEENIKINKTPYRVL